MSQRSPRRVAPPAVVPGVSPAAPPVPAPPPALRCRAVVPLTPEVSAFSERTERTAWDPTAPRGVIGGDGAEERPRVGREHPGSARPEDFRTLVFLLKAKQP